jgi:hypothetical protein
LTVENGSYDVATKRLRHRDSQPGKLDEARSCALHTLLIED